MLEAWLQHPRDRTVLPLPVHDPPCDQWRDVHEMLERLRGSPSCPPASQAVGSTELVGPLTSVWLRLAALQVGTVVVAAVAAAVVVAEDQCVPEVTLMTGLILLKSEVPCRGTEGWATYEAGNRGKDGVRTAALCEGRVALEDAEIELGGVTGR